MSKEAITYIVESEPWKPHAYQKKAVKFLIEHACSALLLDPGLGKTSITLAAIKLLKKKGVLTKVLLIAPLRVAHSTWPGEVQKWTDFNGLKVEVLHGPDKNEALKREADVYIINFDGLDWLLQAQKTKLPSGKTKVTVDKSRFKKLGFDTLVVDELSKMKHINTNRFKALKQVLGTFARRWGLTGSPAANGLLDLFGQCYVLDEGNALGQYITSYRLNYFLPDRSGFGWVIREGAEKEIYERLQPLALRMAAEDHLDLPELVENVIRVDLPDKVKEIYDRLEEDLITRIDDKVVTAATAAVASMKLRQVANGGLYLNPDVLDILKGRVVKSEREWLDLHDAKTQALEELVEELQGKPLLVAIEFGHDLARLRKAFPQAVFAADTPASKFKDLERRWNAGEISMLAGHPGPLAHGLNLQAAGNHVCWHSLTWDYEVYDQFIRRVRRQGNKHSRVFVHHLVARGTIDEAILKIASSNSSQKARGQQALFDALKQLSKKRKNNCK